MEKRFPGCTFMFEAMFPQPPKNTYLCLQILLSLSFCLARPRSLGTSLIKRDMLVCPDPIIGSCHTSKIFHVICKESAQHVNYIFCLIMYSIHAGKESCLIAEHEIYHRLLIKVYSSHSKFMLKINTAIFFLEALLWSWAASSNSLASVV